MKGLLCIVCIYVLVSCKAQQPSAAYLESMNYQNEANEEFADPETSILTLADLKEFKALAFYPVDLKYSVEATFVRTPDEKPFLMPTSTDRLPEYVKYGEAHFELEGKQLKLSLFQSVPVMIDPEYTDYLFLPFTDLTSGVGSYGGGRFLDARIPEGGTMIINFNKAYNPYCAYNSGYSCPIPPRENDLTVHIEAGVKDFGEHH